MKLIALFLVSVLMSFLVGCSDGHIDDSGHTEEHNETEENFEVIKLSDEVMKEFGIEVKEAGPGVIKNHIDLTGEIIAEPSKISHIVPRFSGIVQNVNKTVGEK